MPRLGRVLLYDEKLYRGKGAVNVWMRGIRREYVAEAKLAAPKRTGMLAANIRGTVSFPAKRQVQVAVYSEAPHTMYVLRGTGEGPDGAKQPSIYSNAGWLASFDGEGIPRMGYFRNAEGVATPYRGKLFYASVVRGQSSNNYLAKAWKVMGRRHRALPIRAVPDKIR